LEGAQSSQPVYEIAIGIEPEAAIQVEREVVQDHTPVSIQRGPKLISIQTWLPEPRRSKKRV
jgi:hypothetical protein